MVADLSGTKTRQNGHFVISNQREADLQLESPAVRARTKLAPTPRPRLFDNMDTKIYSIAILHGFPGEIRLTETRPFVGLAGNDLLLSSLRSSLVDLVLVTRKSPIAHCQFVEDLYSAWSRDYDYILRVFPQRNQPLSVNRCSDNRERFIPRSFRLDIPSMGQRNGCNGFRFTVSDVLPNNDRGLIGRMVGAVAQGVQDGGGDGVVGGNFACITNRETRAFAALDDAQILNKLDALAAGANAPLNNGGRPPAVAEPLWQTEEFFRAEWVDLIKTHQRRLMPWRVIQNSRQIRQWFEFIHDAATPAESRFRCWLCNKFFALAGISPGKMDGFANATGKLHPHYESNLRTINGHAKSGKHQEVIKALKAEGALGLEDMVAAMRRKVEMRNSEQKMTSMIRSIYAEARMNIPFASHKLVVNLQVLNGLDLGRRLTNHGDANKLTAFLSEQMHMQLVAYLKDSGSNCAILIDESSDRRQRSFLVILLQVMEENTPVVYFYHLLQLSSNTTAQGLQGAMEKQFEVDRLTNYFRHNLRSFASDGAR